MPFSFLARGAAAVLFGALSAVRRKRVFHPVGSGHEATVTFDGDGPAELFRRTEPQRAVVRLSRGVGLPESWPDILGLAVKLPDAYGPGRDQDFLLATSGSGAATRHLLVPTRATAGRPYSSILLFRVGDELVVIGALPEGDDPPVFRLVVAGPAGAWRPVGRLEVGAALPDDVSRELRYNPANTGPDIRPIGPLNRLRDPAYRGSQRARPDATDEIRGASGAQG
ncbi:MAG: hypothetical protein KY443_04965 [Actinobacteria bacterium]|nr:hypothetical protein [Actinomycetota bacterium]